MDKEAFDKLLAWLDPDRDKAGERYEKIRLRLIRIFACRGCCDAEDLTDLTVNVVIGKINWLSENYVGDPAVYFYAVAKKIYLERLKKKPPPDIPIPDPPSEEVEQVCNYLEECLQELPPTDRDLALQYHQGEKRAKIQNRKALAERLKISRNALRIRVCHIHSRLKECIEQRLQRAATG
jgi:hypothetical protein